jgi:plasmid stabilization system protein ParE
VTLPIRFSDRAEADFAEAAAWYAMCREGLDQQFIDRVTDAVERIRRFPETWEQPIPGVHRVSVRKFPYSIYYVIETDQIKILAIYHVRRDPRGWQERI